MRKMTSLWFTTRLLHSQMVWPWVHNLLPLTRSIQSTLQQAGTPSHTHMVKYSHNGTAPGPSSLTWINLSCINQHALQGPCNHYSPIHPWFPQFPLRCQLLDFSGGWNEGLTNVYSPHIGHQQQSKEMILTKYHLVNQWEISYMSTHDLKAMAQLF